MEFKTNNGIWGNMFGVPCVVADHLLKIVDGEHIKVLLYILRNSGKDCSEEEISDNTGVDIRAVADAVKFWQQANVITPQQTSQPYLSDIAQPSVKQTENITESPVIQQRKTKEDISRTKHWTGKEIEDMKKNNSDFADLLKAVQPVLGAVNPIHTNNIANMYFYLGMKQEVIMILVRYCKEIGKDSPKYIYTIACQWVNDNINTLDLATEEVERLKKSHDYVNQVKRTLKITRLAEKQEIMIRKWHEWNITMEMIEEAYEKSLPKCENKLSIDYINGIITNWHEEGISTLQAIQEDKQKSNSGKYDKKFKNKDNDFNIDMYKIFVNDF